MCTTFISYSLRKGEDSPRFDAVELDELPSATSVGEGNSADGSIVDTVIKLFFLLKRLRCPTEIRRSRTRRVALGNLGEIIAGDISLVLSA